MPRPRATATADGTLDTPAVPPSHDDVAATRCGFAEIVYHPVLARIGAVLPLEPGQRVVLGRRDPLFGDGLPVDDPYVSREQVAITWDGARGLFRVEPVAGARLELSVRSELSQTPFALTGARPLPPDAVVSLGERILLRLGTRPLDAAEDELGIVGHSAAAHALRAAVRRVARFDGPVLLLGETGTGKELVASALHALRGGKGPLVALNMGGLDPGTAGSELFGHTRGAFTDAHRDRDGAFAQARGGTLFLDEIGELPPELQKKLLRVLESRRYTPLGGQREQETDAFVVSATHVPLADDVAAGAFRRDLFERLSVLTVALPPLRERRSDIPRLFARFLGQQIERHPELAWLAAGPDERGRPPIPLSFLLEQVAASWPGNVRALRNTAIAVAAHNVGRARFAAPEGPAPSESGRGAEPRGEPRIPTSDELVDALTRTGGNIRQAAAHLGASRYQLYRWLSARGVSVDALRRAPE